MKRLFAIIAVVAAFSCSHQTDFSLADTFAEGCIFAKDKPVRIFGTGEGFISVELLSWGEIIAQDKVHGANGRWEAILPAMPAGGPYELRVHAASNTISRDDIYVGRVILLGGQSNLQFKLKASSTPQSEWKSDSLLREYSLPHLEAGEPYAPIDGWIRCTEENAGDWSAIGYLVGKGIRKATGEAVAVINCYQGASVIESWIPEEIARLPKYAVPDEERHGDFLNQRYSAWNKPGTLYSKVLSEITPYGISNVIWYQGESNTGDGEVAIYQDLFGELLKSWRDAFDDPSLSFVVVQLADFDDRDTEAWHRLQDIQAGLPDKFPFVASVPCKDVCESSDIHPRDKSVLSQRIVAAILQL